MDNAADIRYNGIGGIQMKRKFSLMLGVTLGVTLYCALAIPIYYLEGESLNDHPVIGALYFSFIAWHAGLVLAAMAFQWLGMWKKRRLFINMAIVLMIFSMIELCLLIYPVLFLLPLILLDMFAKFPVSQ